MQVTVSFYIRKDQCCMMSTSVLIDHSTHTSILLDNCHIIHWGQFEIWNKIQENGFGNVVCKMADILPKCQCVSKFEESNGRQLETSPYTTK